MDEDIAIVNENTRISLIKNFFKNNSKNTRISMDFKALLSSNYDKNSISDKIIIKRGRQFKQNEWYSTKHYYMEL